MAFANLLPRLDRAPQAACGERGPVAIASDRITVTGSHGLLVADAASGRVLNRVEFNGSDEYADIVRFDVSEWATTWNTNPAGAQLDILDIGYWTEGGDYEAPEDEWRDDVRAARLERQQRTGEAVVKIGEGEGAGQ